MTKEKKEIEQLQAEIERLKELLQRIQQWCEAYPIDIFPEPDLAECKTRLGDKLLSRLSASNMRYVVTKLAEMIQHRNDT